jgi:oligopeptide transport system ATP-binding protein
MTSGGDVLLDIRGLTMDYVSSSGLFGREERRVRVLEDLDLQIYRGETLGVVGESGCGKTTLANCVVRFVKPSGGQVIFDGRDILALDHTSLRKVRSEMQIVFQNPFNSLNPRMTVMDLVAEPLRTHADLRAKALRGRVLELLEEVGLGEEHMERHPHELSGGQAQRVALARALALNPKLLLLDEPTSALDVSVQAQIVNLLESLQADHNLTYMFISHGLGVVQHISDRIAVLYLGEVVELAPRNRIFQAPQHPYTQALFSATPIPDPDSGKARIVLEGSVPSPADPPPGCRFHTRCPFVMDVCRKAKPGKTAVAEGHWARCYLLEK